MSNSRNSSLLAQVVLALMIAVFYGALVVLAQLLVTSLPYSSYFWPAAGLAVASLFVAERRWAVLGIGLGAFVSSGWLLAPELTSTTALIGVSAALAVAAVVQAVTAAALLTRFDTLSVLPIVADRTPDFNSSQFMRFLTVGAQVAAAAIVATLLGGALTTTTLVTSGVLASALGAPYAWLYFLSNFLGIFALTLPLLMLARTIQRRQVGKGAAIQALDLGLLTTVLLFAVLWRLEGQRIAAEFDGNAEAATLLIEAAIHAPHDDIEPLTAYAYASGAFSRDEFRRFVTSTLGSELDGSQAQALGWAQVVPASARTQFEDSIQKEGLDGFQITELDEAGNAVPAAMRAQYVPLTYIESGSEPALQPGLDLASIPAFGSLLQSAQEAGQIAAASSSSPDGSGQHDLLVAAPVFRSGVDADAPGTRQREVEGYMIGIYSIPELVSNVRSVLNRDDLDIYLFDVTDAADAMLLSQPDSVQENTDMAAGVSPDSLASGLYYSTPIEVHGREWQLVMKPSSTYEAARRSLMPWLVVAGALMMTGGAVTFLIQRQRASDALTRSEENLQRAQAISRTGSWVYDIQGGRLECSAETCHIVDLDASELTTLDRFFASAHPDDKPMLASAWQRALQGEPFDLQHRIVVDGLDKWVRHQAEVRTDAHGAPMTGFGAIQDISERKYAEDELRNQRMLLQTVIDSTPDWIFIKDREHRYRLVNKGYAISLGIAPEEAVGKNDIELGFAPDVVMGDPDKGIRGFWADDLEVMERGVHKLVPVEPAMLHDEEMFLQTIKAPIRNAEGEVWGVLGYVHDITERERTAAALRSSDARFAAAFLASPAALVITRLDTNQLVDANPAFLQLFGYGREEILGRTALELGMYAHPDERPAMIDAVASGRPVRNQELMIRSKTGAMRTVLISMEPIELSGLRSIITMMVDITERKAAEAGLHRRTEELQILLEASRELSAALNPHSVYQVLHQYVARWIPCDGVIISNYDSIDQMIRCVYFAGNDGEVDISTFPPIPLEPEGQGTQSLVIRSGKSLLLSDYEQHLRNTQTVYYVDDDGRLKLDVDEEEERARSAVIVPLWLEGSVGGALQVYSRQVNAYTEEHVRYVEALVFRVTSIMSNVRLFARLQDELAERRRAEIRVRQLNAELERRVAERTQDLHIANAELTRALRTKDEFLATMSHELRTPLTGVLALSEMLAAEIRGPLNDYQRKYVENIENSGRHLLTLINDILDLSKVEAGKLELQLEYLIINDICLQSLTLIKEIAANKRLSIHYQCSDESIVTLVDGLRLKQMLVNLLSNAVKFTADGGHIELQVSDDPTLEVIRLSVCDTGIGISEADMSRLFKPFTQLDSSLARHHEGTGLGLALVKRLVELHGGTVDVESEGIPGLGSRFTLTLPWKRPFGPEVFGDIEPSIASSPENQSLPHDMPEFEGASGSSVAETASTPLILVAEDNAFNLEALCDYLREIGYEVVPATNGEEALTQVRTVTPSLFLMDVQMPILDGLEATRRLRRIPQFSTTPIIVLTAFAMAGDRERCLEAGADDYMSKPFSFRDLARRIELQLAQHST